MADLSLDEMASILVLIDQGMPAQVSLAMDYATRMIQEEAQAEIGTYQSTAGPFGAWQELADATKADRRRKGFGENAPLLRTGAMRDSIGRSFDETGGSVGSNSDIAVWQELGTSRIPPRSFLGHAAVVKSREIEQVIGQHIHAVLSGGGTTIPIK